MPILKYKDVILHFAHIPKCGGTSIERYIQGLDCVSMAFVDEAYVARPPLQHWNISSPQHVDGESLGRLFPSDFFTAFFAIVRDPLARLESAYKFQRTREGRIGNMSFDSFVKTELGAHYLTKGWMDNHFYPQSGFFYPSANYQVFKLEEDGANHAKAFIDNAFFGNLTARQMTHSNKAGSTSAFDAKDLELSDEGLEIAQSLYAMDFDNFGYARRTEPAPNQMDLAQTDDAQAPERAAG